MDVIAAYRGIAPGKILFNELRHRDMTQRKLASLIGEHYQTVCSFIKGHRGIPLETTIKLDSLFGFERGFFAIIQTYYELERIEQSKRLANDKKVPNIRSVVFWDTDISVLDWERNKDYIIERVLSRGNENEKQQIRKFYGLPE